MSNFLVSLTAASSALCALALAAQPAQAQSQPAPAKNVIFFVGDGMGVSTVTATRIYSVGVDGQLAMDKLPYTALSRTYSADAITPDSAPTMSMMMSGVNTNNGVIGYGPDTEAADFNGDGNGQKTTTLLELAKQAGKKVGVVSTARITHATPAACYAHINLRDLENDIALQALPTDATYNQALASGVDLLIGGGRRHFLPNNVVDEEGSKGSRTDGRDLRAEYQAAGYNYCWESAGFQAVNSLPVLGLFESSHMEYEYDRPLDAGGEPSLADITSKSIDLLSAAGNGYFLMVEGGRIDHAHHEGNAWRAIVDAEALDNAIAAALGKVDLSDTLIIVSADHSHVFNIAGYPLRPPSELAYTPKNVPADWAAGVHSGLFNVVYDIDGAGNVTTATDSNGVPYTVLVYGNGPGYRGTNPRVDPKIDTFKGKGGVIPNGPEDPAYFQESAVPLSSETHAGEEVAIYAIGPGSSRIRGTVKNSAIFRTMRLALGL